MQYLGWSFRTVWGLIPNCSPLLCLQACTGGGPHPVRVNVPFPCKLHGFCLGSPCQPPSHPMACLCPWRAPSGVGRQAWAGLGYLEHRNRLLAAEPKGPAHTFARTLWLPVTGHLQLCFRGASLLQACTVYATWHASHPPFPVSGRFLTSESFQFWYWRAPSDLLLSTCSSYCSVYCFTAVLCLFEIRAFLPLFHGSFLPLSFAVIEIVLKNNPKVHLVKKHGFQ